MFRSRWNALFWASGVLLTAYCSVPSQDEPSDADQFTAMVGATQKPKHDAPHHANPWAKDTD